MRKSVAAYPPDWKETARRIKDEAGWKCVRCGHEHNWETGHVLTVHHLDLNPSNNEWWNIPALCQRRHLQIQAKVFMEQQFMFEHTEWFRPYAAGYYAKQNSFPTDKEFVMAHLNMLLEYGWPRSES
jgi:hypothetical protein